MQRKKFLKLCSLASAGIFIDGFINPVLNTKEFNGTYSKPMEAGPKYWTVYEYCYTHDAPIPEKRWKKNVDWVIKNFKDYGYNMVTNDGWIEGAQTINSNGYITKYNDSWNHGFKYWSEYLSQRGMELGVYYNPLWLTKAAYEKNVFVQGTNHKTKDIVGKPDFNAVMHWVDVAKPGAKEWIQGYVKYFINQGATFLRIDFLRNYENMYGTTKYAKALKWICEAADNKIFLSLVMPNCFHHAETELHYGDMIRIDADCFEGGWDFVSDRRRTHRKVGWPQYGNAFDGFIGFSDISGRGQLILDGDFNRLNTLSNDKERKFQISLFIIAGSPIAIADQYDTIGGSEWIYQNKELLELNDKGFIGKPLSYNIQNVQNSSRWVGQLPNGDWIVGLFNREDYIVKRSIDLNKELGLINGTDNIRDLWSHSNLGKMRGKYSVKLAAHECKILKIENSDNPKYEAEVASLIGHMQKRTYHHNYSGMGYVSNLKALGNKIIFAVNTSESGNYTLSIRYANANGITATASVYVNNSKIKSQLHLPPLTNWNAWNNINKNISLKSGVNYIAIQHDLGDNGMFNIDYIQIK